MGNKRLKNMNTLPTAEDFLDDNFDAEAYSGEVFTDFAFPRTTVEKAMIEFAKLHVEAALKKAHKDARIVLQDGRKVIAFGKTMGGEFVSGEIDKHSITNAYPLTNIK